MEALEVVPQRLSKELREYAETMSRDEARFLVDAYYNVQKARIQTENRRSAGERETDEAAYPLLDWLLGNLNPLEGYIKPALEHYADKQPVGRWAMSICGIGPVLAAGLLAEIEIEKAPTVGHIWRFAGLDPTRKWLGKVVAKAEVKRILGKVTGHIDEAAIAQVGAGTNRTMASLRALWPRDKKTGVVKPDKAEHLIAALAKRPWNGRLKTLCWKIGESFVMVSGNEKDVYGKVWASRKAQEIARNEAGDFAEQAAAVLAKTPNHAQAAIYKTGKLSASQIHMRAQRYAVKLFLSGWHEAAYFATQGKLPRMPYVMTHLGHTGYIAPPNMEVITGWREARAAAGI